MELIYLERMLEVNPLISTLPLCKLQQITRSLGLSLLQQFVQWLIISSAQ